MASRRPGDGVVSYPDLGLVDGSSDYGSDLSSDEEQQLNTLLSQFALPVKSSGPSPAIRGPRSKHERNHLQPVSGPRSLAHIRYDVTDTHFDVRFEETEAGEVLVEIEGDTDETADGSSLLPVRPAWCQAD